MANYLLQSCDGLTNLVVDPNGSTIVTGGTYYFNFTGTTTPGCFSVVEESSSPADDYLSAGLTYTNCFECIKSTPRSANTETNIVYTLNSDVNNGVVVYYVETPPHPVWTDGYGTQVTQLNMITLGGPNGLNS